MFKTLVWELSRWRNAQAEAQGQTPPIPENSITKPPSAELAPGQQDTDSLPAYELLDALLDDYVEQDLGSGDLIAKGYDPDLVQRVIMLVDRAEYKRRQYPPGPKISQKNFGRDRRLPITNSWREPPPGQTKAPRLGTGRGTAEAAGRALTPAPQARGTAARGRFGREFAGPGGPDGS